MKKLKVGIIGFGFSGSVFHAPIIQAVPSLELAAVASSQTEKVITQCPHVKVYAHPEELLADADIELVIVTAPNQLHFPLAKQALEHHKHVVVEKPFVLNTQEGEALIRLAQERNLVLSVYHNRRWDNDFMALQTCMAQGLLGEIYQCEIRYERFRPQIAPEKWREQNLPGSGLLYDLGSHLIDQALCLFGWPDSVYADIASQRTAAVVDDYFHLLLGYKKLKVVLHVGSVVRKPGPRFLVHGSKGSFIKYGMDQQERMLLHEVGRVGKGPQVPCPPIIGGHVAKNAPLPTLRADDRDNVLELLYEKDGVDVEQVSQLPMGDYRQYYQQLYRAIVAGELVPVSAKEGLDCIRLIELCQKFNQRQEST